MLFDAAIKAHLTFSQVLVPMALGIVRRCLMGWHFTDVNKLRADIHDSLHQKVIFRTHSGTDYTQHWLWMCGFVWPLIPLLPTTDMEHRNIPLCVNLGDLTHKTKQCPNLSTEAHPDFYYLCFNSDCISHLQNVSPKRAEIYHEQMIHHRYQ